MCVCVLWVALRATSRCGVCVRVRVCRTVPSTSHQIPETFPSWDLGVQPEEEWREYKGKPVKGFNTTIQPLTNAEKCILYDAYFHDGDFVDVLTSDPNSGYLRWDPGADEWYSYRTAAALKNHKSKMNKSNLVWFERAHRNTRPHNTGPRCLERSTHRPYSARMHPIDQATVH